MSFLTGKSKRNNGKQIMAKIPDPQTKTAQMKHGKKCQFKIK